MVDQPGEVHAIKLAPYIVACESYAPTSPTKRAQPGTLPTGGNGLVTADGIGGVVTTSRGTNVVQTPVAWDAHLDVPTQVENWTSPQGIAARRQALGMHRAGVAEFVEGCEFISLGCFCAVARALQALDLKKYAYPFDWVRSSMDGIIHCLDTDFVDFLTFSSFRQEGEYRVFGGTRWGGSFWHHDLASPATAENMNRRIERFYGRREVPASKPRVFVRNINSTRELESSFRLYEALQRACAQCKVYLLLIIDLQKVRGPIRISGGSSSETPVLFFRVHEALFTNTCPGKSGKPLQAAGEAYAEAIAFATNFWGGQQDAMLATEVVSDLLALAQSCQHWDGGDPARDLFCPRRFWGLQLERPSVSPMPGLIDPTQVANQILPESLVLGNFQTHAFGYALQLQLPEGSCAGSVLHLRLINGILSACVYRDIGGTVAFIGAAAITRRAA